MNKNEAPPKGWYTEKGEWVPWLMVKLVLVGLVWIVLLGVILVGVLAFWGALLHG